MMNYEWIDRRVPEPDFDLILLGALTADAELFGANKDFWYPIKGGIEALPKSFLPHVNNINCNMKAVKIIPDERSIEFEDGTDVVYERLISTLPLPEVVKLIGDVPGEVQQASDSLEHNSILCVNIGIDRADVTKNHWMYFYEDDFVPHRISFPMNLSAETVPAGKSSVSCEVAYSKYRLIEKENIIERTFDDLVKAKLFKKSDTIEASNVVDLFYAYVIYDLNHRRNVKVIHDYLRSKNILPCGRFGEWEYFNMDQTILSGKSVADEINIEASGKGECKIA
jgi:UDP-galactopyranose mutase